MTDLRRAGDAVAGGTATPEALEGVSGNPHATVTFTFPDGTENVLTRPAEPDGRGGWKFLEPIAVPQGAVVEVHEPAASESFRRSEEGEHGR